MAKVIKKILTEDDLLKFCFEHKQDNFSSKETGYQLAVKVPTTFEVDEEVDDNHRGMMKLKIRIFHTGLNRNKSYVSKNAAEKAMSTIADRPILAAIHKLDDGTYDFEGHEMEVITDENGNEEVKYIESQVGSFSSEPAFWEYDSELDKNFVCAYAYISREYTKACEIIERKNGTKNSCELFIDELSYNAKEGYLELNNFYVNASTLLGSHNDGTEIGEGMQGSRADIVDFSVNNNSVKYDKDDKLIELLENINNKLSNFNIGETKVKQLSKKEGSEFKMEKFKELLEKYNKTEADIPFGYEDMSDEELELKFAELFENETEDPEDNNESITISYELSHDDIRCAIYELLRPYEETDNACYYISAVYDTYFAYEDWCSNKIYGQAYQKDGDNISFVGERYNLHRVLLTDSEYSELNTMRNNYAELIQYKEGAENKILMQKKEEILAQDKYSVLYEKDENDKFVNTAFENLLNSIDNYSVEELEKEAKVILADYYTENANQKFEEAKPVKKQFVNPSTKKTNSRYGNLKFE